MQINRILYRKALKIVEHHKNQSSYSIPNINVELRCKLGFTDSMIDFFWKSSFVLRSMFDAWKFEQEFLNALINESLFDQDTENW